MILAEILDTSILISLFRYLFRGYQQLGRRSGYIYNHSQVHSLLNSLGQAIELGCRNSFLGRITEIRQTTSAGGLVLDSSRALQSLLDFYKSCQDRVRQYLRSSWTVILANETKEELYFLPVRIASIVSLITLIVNTVSSLILQKQIDLWGWLMRGVLLFVASAGLFCQADWPTVKKNSLLLKGLEKGIREED